MQLIPKEAAFGMKSQSGSNTLIFLDTHQIVSIAESAAHWHEGRLAVRIVARICPRFLA